MANLGKLSGAFLLGALLAAGCGDSSDEDEPFNPYQGTPPRDAPIARTDGTEISGATEWRWIPFGDAFCTTATGGPPNPYQFGTATTGLAINWGPVGSTELVVFLQGGGACWDFITCGGAAQLGVAKTASTGPFGPAEFAAGIYNNPGLANSWVRRANLPAALANATVVFVPYCTGDVHGGDATTTYPSPLQGLPAITWRHSGHANVMAFLRRLGATFPSPSKVVIAGSSAGGFGSLANYPAFRWYWPDARSYLVDDSGPPLIGNAIPPVTRSAWYASWNLGVSLDAFCNECRTDMSAGIRELAARFPNDRIGLVSHLRDETIRFFYGTFTFTPAPGVVPMPAATFESELRRLGTEVMAPARARYFFTAGAAGNGLDHPTLEDPTVIDTPSPGLEEWLQQMLSDSTAWTSVADPSPP